MRALVGCLPLVCLVATAHAGQTPPSQLIVTKAAADPASCPGSVVRTMGGIWAS